jgi:HEAT repeat protein
MDGRAIEGLQGAMRDENWWVRQNSAQALSEIPGGVAALVGGLEDEDRFARDASIERLMAMGLVRKAVDAVKGGAGDEQERYIVRQLVVLGRGEYLQDKAANEKVAG